MSDTMTADDEDVDAGGPTDAQHSWTAQFCGIDPKASTAAPADGQSGSNGASEAPTQDGGDEADSGQSAAAAPGGTTAQTGAPPDGGAPGDAVAQQTPAADDAAQANQSVDPDAAQANQSVDPDAAQANQSVDPDAAQANQSVDPDAAQANQSVDPDAQANQSIDPDAQPDPSIEPGQGSEATASEPDLPPAQKERADAALQKLSPTDRASVLSLLDGAKSDGEKQYLMKALAAGHTPDELADFDQKIQGKDARWLNDNLRLVGDSQGKGIIQQWSYSCGPTTVEAIKGELDPIYAMQVRQQNPNLETANDADGMAANPGIGQDQKTMLQQGGGNPTSRDDPDGTGTGLIFKNLLNSQSGPAGLSFDSKKIGRDVTMDDALNTMQSDVKSGLPVPITVGDAKSPYAHAALVTAVDDGPPRSYTIHDPYYGKTQTFTEDQIKNDQVDVGGWHHVGVVFPPSLKQ
jgi:hypothetical protein